MTAVQQADASNQTDSLPPSSDEESAVNDVEDTDEMDKPVVNATESAVDLSGLELLSSASIEQIERLVKLFR